MAQCTAPIRGHRSAAAAAACPVCGRLGRYSSYSYGYPSYPSYLSNSGTSSSSSSSSSRSLSSGSKRNAKWSPAGSTVLYTEAQIRTLTPIHETIVKQTKKPDKYDLFLCHAWDDRKGIAKELYEKKGYTDITRKLGDKLSVSYKTIERNVAVSELIPELKEDFANNNLTLKEGAGLASLSSEAQLEVHKLIQTATEKGEKVNSEDVMKIKILEGEKKKLLAEIDATKSELEKRTKEIATLKERIEKNPTSSNRARDLSKIQKKEEEEDALKEKIDELKKQFNISDKEAGARIAAKDWYAMTSARLNKISSTMSVHIDRLDKEEKDRLRKMIDKIQNLLDHEI